MLKISLIKIGRKKYMRQTDFSSVLDKKTLAACPSLIFSTFNRDKQ